MNRVLYTGDCLDILEGNIGTGSASAVHGQQSSFDVFDDHHIPDESVDLIYLDPPFNSNSNYNLPFKGRDKATRPVEAFKDTWEWTEQDDARLGELKTDPRTRNLASIVELATDTNGARTTQGGGYETSFLSASYGVAVAGDETGAETDGKHLSALRSYGQPLAQTCHGRGVRGRKLPKRNRLALLQHCLNITQIFRKEARRFIVLFKIESNDVQLGWYA